ncbi:hypothetical protein TruAng_009531 [Truncatella angustata]|nr:hypothetical protein TruAng_009531 [Truncatella angustata]
MSILESRSIIDLTHPIDDNIPIYPGDPTFHCRQSCNIPESGWAVSELSFSSHVGTHIDAPSHRFDGSLTVDAIPLENLVAIPALVVDVSDKPALAVIDLEDLQPYESRIREGMAVFFRTGWDRYWGPAHTNNGKYFEHPYVDRAVAQRLVELGVIVLGVDTMSPDAMSEEGDSSVPEVHDVVLGAGRVIAENLTNLKALQDVQDAGVNVRIMVSLAPLKVQGCDGSPVRAFAWVEKKQV